MEWVEGEPLDKYIERNIVNTVALTKLAEKWLEMARALQACGVAHGDLQQGNVLVVGGELKLVDYDGMYVPALDGKLSAEIGHRNYQHPRRSEFDFGPNVDNFSNWVIYTALIALSKNPALWNTFRADESLLFRREDFVNPQTSPLFSALTSCADAAIHLLALNLQALSSQPFYATPFLDPTTIREPVNPPSPVSEQTSSWWVEHVKSTQSASPEPDSSWIDEHTKEPLKAVITGLGILARLTFIVLPVVATILAVGLGLSPARTMLGFLSVISTYIGILFWKYNRDPGLQSLFRARSELHEKQASFRGAQAEFQRRERQLSATRQSLESARQHKTQIVSRITAEENEAVSKTQERSRGQVGSVNQRRRQLVDQETSELQQVNSTTSRQLNAAHVELSKVDNDQAAELGAALANVQRDSVLQFLRRFDLRTAGITGIGAGFKTKLDAAGIRTAADVDYRVHTIHGIGQVKAAALFAWRQAYEQSAKARMPKNLDSTEQRRIQDKYSIQRQTLQQQVLNLQAKKKSQDEAIRQRYIAMRLPLDREEAAIHRTTSMELQNIRAEFAKKIENAVAVQEQSISAHEKVNIENKKLSDKAEYYLLQKRREHEQVKRVLAVYQNITFRKYVIRVLTTK